LLAHGFEQADLAVPGDHGHRAGQPAIGHFAAQHVHQALRAFGAQAHVKGLGEGQSGVMGHGALLKKAILYTSLVRRLIT
jgi:hypothetical protein